MENESKSLVQKYVNKDEITKQELTITRQETIAKLFLLRKKTIRLIKNASKTLNNRQKELAEINDGICKVQGHTFTDWEIHDGVLDRTWYYTRNCEICNKKEQTENEPKEVKEKVLKSILW